MKRIKTAAAASAAQQRSTQSLAQSDFSKIGLAGVPASGGGGAGAGASSFMRE